MDGAKATSSSTGILLGWSPHPRGGIFTCLFKGQKFIFKNELDKYKDITYIHWTHKNKRRFRKSTALIPIKWSRPNSKGQHVATVACPLRGLSFSKPNQELARHLVS